MRFQPALLGLLGLATSASAMLNVTQVASEINELSQLSSKANVIANNITTANSASTVPELVKSLHQMADTMESDIAAINGTRSGKAVGKKRQEDPGVREIERQLVCSSLGVFTAAEDKLLETIIGKQGALAKLPGLTKPLAAALKILNEKVDLLAFALLGLTTNCDTETTGNQPIDRSRKRGLQKHKD